MNKPILTERIMASEALRAEYVQDVIHWLADQWSITNSSPLNTITNTNDNPGIVRTGAPIPTKQQRKDI